MKEFVMRLIEEIRRRLGMLWKHNDLPVEEYQRPAFQGLVQEENTIKEGDDLWTLYNQVPPEI